MEEAGLLKERLQAITDKRKIQEDIANKRGEVEEEKLKLQYLKKKALREQWLMDGLSIQSAQEQEAMKLQAQDNQQQSKVLQSKINRMENEIEALETQETTISTNERLILKRLKEVEQTTEDIIKGATTGVNQTNGKELSEDCSRSQIQKEKEQKNLEAVTMETSQLSEMATIMEYKMASVEMGKAENKGLIGEADFSDSTETKVMDDILADLPEGTNETDEHDDLSNGDRTDIPCHKETVALEMGHNNFNRTESINSSVSETPCSARSVYENELFHKRKDLPNQEPADHTVLTTDSAEYNYVEEAALAPQGITLENMNQSETKASILEQYIRDDASSDISRDSCHELEEDNLNSYLRVEIAAVSSDSETDEKWRAIFSSSINKEDDDDDDFFLENSARELFIQKSEKKEESPAETNKGVETETDLGVETETDLGVETETDQGVKTETDLGVETETDQGVKTETDQRVETETDQGVKTETDQGVKTETDLGVETETDQGVETETDQGVKTETDQGVKTETDQGVETETDLGVETETDLGVETETDQGVKTETDLGVETETDLGVETETDQGVETETDLGVETETDQGVETETDQGVETETDLGVETETDLGVEVETDQGVETETDQGVETETDQGVKTETDQGVEAETDQGVEAETDQGVETEIPDGEVLEQPEHMTENEFQTQEHVYNASPFHGLSKISEDEEELGQGSKHNMCAMKDDSNKKVPDDYCVIQETKSEHVSTEHVDFRIARKQWLKMEEQTKGQTQQPAAKQGTCQGGHSFMYTPVRNIDRPKKDPGLESLVLSEYSHSQFSPCSEDSGLDDSSYRSPHDDPETPIEREIRLAMEREDSLRQERGISKPPKANECIQAAGPIILLPEKFDKRLCQEVEEKRKIFETQEDSCKPLKSPSVKTPSFIITSSPTKGNLYHDVAANNIIILEPDTYLSSPRRSNNDSSVLSPMVHKFNEWPSDSSNVIILETSNLIIRSASEFCLNTIGQDTQESTFLNNPFFKLRSRSTQSLIDQEIQIVRQREEELKVQRASLYAKENYSTVLASPNLLDNFDNSEPPMRCKSSPSSPMKTAHKMNRSTLSCENKFSDNFPGGRRKSAMAIRWEEGKFANNE